MKNDNLKIKKEVRKAEPVNTGDLDKALDRIYRQYGNDLGAFFRDAKESMLKRQALTHDERENYFS